MRAFQYALRWVTGDISAAVMEIITGFSIDLSRAHKEAHRSLSCRSGLYINEVSDGGIIVSCIHGT